MTELEFVDIHHWEDNGKGEHVRAVKTAVIVDGLVAEIQELEKTSKKAGYIELDRVLKVLGAKTQKETT